MKKKENKKQGFAITGVLYSILLLFVVMLIGILNNLEGRKQLLDVMKEDTIKASESDEVIKDLYEQINQLKKQLNDTNDELTNTRTQLNNTINELPTMNYLYANFAHLHGMILSDDQSFTFVKTVPFDNNAYLHEPIILQANSHPGIAFHTPGIVGGALTMGNDGNLYWKLNTGPLYRINMTLTSSS